MLITPFITMERLLHRLLHESRSSEFSRVLNSNILRKSTRPSISYEEWSQLCESSSHPKLLMNDLIMDFLAIESSKNTVDNFKQESACIIDPSPLIEIREDCKKAIKNQDLQSLQMIIQSQNPNFRKNDNSLSLLMDTWHLANLCRKKNVKHAMKLVTEKLNPVIKYDSIQKDKIQKILLLLVIPEESEDYPYKDLLQEIEHNLEEQVKMEVLKATQSSTEPKIIQLFKVLKWMETRLSQHLEFPKFEDLCQENLNLNEEDSNE